MSRAVAPRPLAPIDRDIRTAEGSPVRFFGFFEAALHLLDH